MIGVQLGKVHRAGQVVGRGTGDRQLTDEVFLSSFDARAVIVADAAPIEAIIACDGSVGEWAACLRQNGTVAHDTRAVVLDYALSC